MMRLLFILYFVPISLACAQDYLFPINPGQTAYLTGNMGEIRPGHFHMGLDVSIQAGTPVLASADGYVSKVRISTYGYGKIIHITHPKTKQQTVYAHLQKFATPLADLMRQKQYDTERFEVEYEPKAYEIPIKRGQVIAYVGNTGSSLGAHLHYEIRTMDNIALDPAEFRFKELPRDFTPPIVSKIALVTAESKSTLQGQWGRSEFTPTKVGKGLYEIAQPLACYGAIGLEVLTHDLMDNANNTYGTQKVEMWVNQKKAYAFTLNQIAHEHNKCMNLHVDFETMRQKNQGFQKCYFAEGNRLKNNYDLKQGNGYIQVADGKEYLITVHFWDIAKNKTTLTFRLVGKRPAKATFIPSKHKHKKPVLKYRFKDNFLVLEAYHLPAGGEEAVFSFNGILQTVPLTTMQAGKAVYLWDLRKGLPDFAQVGSLRKSFHFRKTILPHKNTQFKDNRLRVDFARNPLYDTLYLEASAWGYQMQIGNPYLPLHEAIVVSYALPTIPQNKNKWAAYHGGSNYQESWWEGNRLYFRTQTFGYFHVREDTEAPKIKLLRKNAKEVVLQARDNLSGLSSHKAWLNGKFILLDFESKGGILTTEPLQANTSFAGKLEVLLKDKAGNETRQIFAL